MRGLILISVVAAGVALASTATAGVTSWQEDFEGVACGELPVDWVGGGGHTEFGTIWDVGSIVCEGSHALGFFGVLGGCWAALAVVPVSLVDLAYAYDFTLEFTVRAGEEPTSGCHGGARAYVEYNATTHWSGDHRGLFYVGQNGELTGSGLSLGTMDLETCHLIGIHYTRVDPTHVSLEYSVDGTPAGSTTLECGAVEDTFRYFHFGALEGSAWYDDIDVTATTSTVGVERDSWGRIKNAWRE